MKLKAVKIKNYRSIEDLGFTIEELQDNSFTYGLIGINEAGKSSFLKALALLDDHTNIKPEINDFHKKENSIDIVYIYEQSNEEIVEAKTLILQQFPEIKITDEELKDVTLVVKFSHPDLTKSKSLVCAYIKSEEREQIESILLDHVYKNSHYTIFWKSEDRYLINKEVSLSAFANDPESISIPLKNCFGLVGLDTKEKIQAKITEISDSTERQILRDALGKKVTELIKQVWPNHPVTITFDISGDLINFHVNDPNGRPRTTGQRSDGFKQFISFLLNVSSQKETDELSNSLILLDEPETHLHPQAQEYFLSELIKITKSENNICFFATHSNYMIDKNDLSRNYKVTKNESNNKTTIQKFDKNTSTYASVNYEVFNVLDDGYHNELYDSLRQKHCDNNTIDSIGINAFDEQYFVQLKKLKKDYPEKGVLKKVTLPTFIRNCIHYPQNKNKIFEKELKESIELLKSYAI